MPTLSERIQDTVNGPTGVRDRSLYDSIQKAIDETRKADLEEYNKLPLHERMQLQLDQKAREENTENWGWASRAGIRGVLQTGSMLGGLTGMAASAAEGLGVPEEYTNPVEEWGYGTYQSLERKASLYPGTEFSSDLLTSPTQAGKWVVEKLIENAPYLAMSWGTGAVGRTIGSRIAEGALGGWLERQTGKKLIEGQLARLGSNTGIIASTAGLEGGGMWGETLQKTGVDNPLSAMALGTVNGFVELAGGSTRVFNRIFGDQTNLYTKAVARMKEALWKGKPISVNDAKIVKRFATGLIQTGREEALEEGIQELNNLANIAINDPTFEKFTWENGLRIAESMVAGGATGGLMGATAAPFNRYGIIQEKIENLSPKELVPTIQQQAQLLAEEPDNKDQQEIVNRLLQRQLGETNPGYQDLLRMYRKEKDPEKKKLLGLQIEVSIQAELDRIKNLGQEKPEEKPPQETPPQTQPEETAAEPEKTYTILKEKPQDDQGTPIDQAFVDEFLRDQGTPPEVMRGATPEEWEAQRSQREFDWRKEERAARSGRMRSAIGRVEDAQTQPYREEVQAAIEASQSQSPEVMDAARQRAEYRRQRIAELRENRKKARLLPLEEARRQRELAELEEEDRAAAEQNIRDVENMFPPKRVVPQKAIPSPGLHAQAEELKASRQELVNAYLESARTGKPPQGNQALRRALTEMDADETRGLQIEALHELERRSGLIPAKKEVRQLFGVDLQEAAGMLEEAFGPDWAREQALRQTQAQGGKRRETLPSIYLTSGGKPFLTEKATTARARELAARGIRTRPVPVEGGFGLQRIEPEVTPSDREDQAGMGGEVGRGQEPGRTVSQPGGGGQTVAAGGVVQAQEGEEVEPETPVSAVTEETASTPAATESQPESRKSWYASLNEKQSASLDKVLDFMRKRVRILRSSPSAPPPGKRKGVDLAEAFQINVNATIMDMFDLLIRQGASPGEARQQIVDLVRQMILDHNRTSKADALVPQSLGLKFIDQTYQDILRASQETPATPAPSATEKSTKPTPPVPTVTPAEPVPPPPPPEPVDTQADMDKVLAALGDEAKLIDALVLELGMPINRVSSALGLLDLMDKVERLPGMKFRRKPDATGTGTTPPAPAGETPPSESTTPTGETPGEPTPPSESILTRLAKAHAAEKGKTERTRLADIRKHFPDLTDEQWQAEISRLHKEGKILLYPLDDPREIKSADREAAVNIAGREHHLLMQVEPEGKAPGGATPPAETPAKEPWQMTHAAPEPTNWQEEHNARLAAPIPKGVMPEGDPNHFLLGQMGSMAKELRGVWETSNDESFHDPKKYPQELTFKTADADTVLYKKNIQYHLNVLSDVHGYTAVDERNENGIHIIEFSWNTKSAKADQGIKAAPIKEGVKRDPSAWGKPKFEIPKVKSKAEKKSTPKAEEKPLTVDDLKSIGREAAEARLQAMPAFQVLGYAKDWKIPLGASKKKEQVIKEILQHVFDALAQLSRIRGYEEELIGPNQVHPDWAKSMESSTGGRIVWSKGNLALLEGYSILGGDVLYSFVLRTPENRVLRFMMDVSSFANTEKQLTDNELKTLLTAREKVVQLEKDLQAQKPEGPFAQGNIVGSRSVPQALVDVAREWLKLLGLQDARIFLYDPKDIQGDGFRDYGLYGDYASARSTNINFERNAGETRIFGPDGKDAYIALNTAKDEATLVEILGHEIGHRIQRILLDNESREVKTAIIREYNQWAKDIGDRTVREVIESRSPLALAQMILGGNASQADKPLRQQAEAIYLSHFNEWFADNVSKWLSRTAEPQSIVEKFFKKAADLLKKLYAAVTGNQYAPNAEVKKWLDEIVAKNRAVAEEAVAESETSKIKEKSLTKNVKEQAKKDIADRTERLKPLNAIKRTPSSAYAGSMGTTASPYATDGLLIIDTRKVVAGKKESTEQRIATLRERTKDKQGGPGKKDPVSADQILRVWNTYKDEGSVALRSLGWIVGEDERVLYLDKGTTFVMVSADQVRLIQEYTGFDEIRQSGTKKTSPLGFFKNGERVALLMPYKEYAYTTENAIDLQVARERAGLPEPEEVETHAPEEAEEGISPKKPWQMTFEEYQKADWDRVFQNEMERLKIRTKNAIVSVQKSIADEKRQAVKKPRRISSLEKHLKMLEDKSDALNKGDYSKWEDDLKIATHAALSKNHELEVRDAQRQGHEIPPEVMQEYPELTEGTVSGKADVPPLQESAILARIAPEKRQRLIDEVQRHWRELQSARQITIQTKWSFPDDMQFPERLAVVKGIIQELESGKEAGGAPGPRFSTKSGRGRYVEAVPFTMAGPAKGPRYFTEDESMAEGEKQSLDTSNFYDPTNLGHNRFLWDVIADTLMMESEELMTPEGYTEFMRQLDANPRGGTWEWVNNRLLLKAAKQAGFSGAKGNQGGKAYYAVFNKSAFTTPDKIHWDEIHQKNIEQYNPTQWSTIRETLIDEYEAQPVEEGDTFERVVWDVYKGQDIRVNTSDTIGYDEVKGARGLHITSDTDYWTLRLEEDYERSRKGAKVIVIRSNDGDVLAEDTQYMMDPDTGVKADSHILFTDRAVLRYGIDWVFAGEQFFDEINWYIRPKDVKAFQALNEKYGAGDESVLPAITQLAEEIKKDEKRLNGALRAGESLPDDLLVKYPQIRDWYRSQGFQYHQWRTQQGQTRISSKPGRGLGSKVETVRNYVKSLARLFNVPIDVVQSVSDLPAHLQRQFRRQSKRGDILRGVYDPESGGVYLVADGIDDRREALTVVLHEVVGHAGLRKVLGEDYNQFLRRMAEGKYGDEIKALMRERGYKDITQAADEWFAEQVEAGTIQPTLWNRFVHFIKQALRKLGFNIEFGKAELVELVRRSREAVTWRNPAGETKAAEPTFDFPAIRTSIRGQHASASLFDKFMSEKIGTGEGHQTFGWGIYVTDLDEVADYYLQTIPRMKNEEEFGFDLWLDNEKIAEEDYSILEEPELNNTLYDYYHENIDINELRNQVGIFTEKKISEYDELTWQREELGIRKRDPHYEALKEYADMARSLLNAIDKNSLTIKPKPDFKRVLYDVTMFKGKQPGDYDLLRWDQPVPEGQREKIAQLMDRYDEYGYLAEVLRDTNLSGEEIYREIEAREGSRGASLALDEVEINGIQYPTGTFSHEKGGGWNYVIFNPLNITIENRAMYSTKPQPGEAKAEHERSWSESITEGLDILRDWVREMREHKDWKTMRPETTWLERIAATPAYYFGKVPALRRLLEAALEMIDNIEHFKNVLFNADGGKGESYIARISQFRKAFKKEYQRWAGYIVDRDRNAVGYTVRRDGDRFQVHNPAGEAVKSYAKWEDAWAFAFQQEAADMAKLDKPFSEAAQQALLAYRTIAFNEYMMLSEPLRRIIEKAQAEGRPVPTVAYPVYGTDKDGKTRKRMMEVDLRVALDMMGERIGHFMPRLRRQGRYQLIAEKDGIRELQYFKTRAGLEREAAKLRKEGYKIQKGRARQLPGEVYGELGPTMAMENVINQALRDMRRGGDKTRLEDFGLKGEWRKTTDGKDEFVVTGQFDSRYVEAFKTLKGHGFYEGAWHFVEPGENFEEAIVKRLGEFTTTFNLELAFAQELVQQVADVLRSHGSLAHRIKRSSATGEEVWRGYSEEPFEAIVTAGRNIAAGHAKGIMARKMHDAIMGRDISWQQFVEQAGPDSTYEDYLEMVNERRIDPATQPNAYKDGVDYMKDMLRPSESLDRTIGMIKGAAMFKYIAGRVSAPVINLTALPTVVVASLRGHAHIPFAKAVRLLTKAIRDYTTYSFHPEKLDAETRELFQEIRDRGWDMAQYNEEALEALRSKTAQRYDKFIDTLMLGFSVSERLNRAATIAAAYRGIKDQHEGEWTPEAREAALEQAKFASDRAHSIYGKANYPMLMRGGGAFGETAKSFYMFKNFAHNFLQNFIELGFKKREAAAAAWLIMSPVAVGGATAALPVSLLLAALRQVMDDDPEEALMEFLQENVGDSAEMAARFGVFGLAGVNLKGSLQVGITDIPTKVTDLLGAPYEVWVDLTGGIGDMIRGDITKGAEKVSPLFLGNMLKALREYNEGLTTKSNAPIFFGNEQARADTTDAVLRFLSFNPSRLARIHEKQFNERLTEAEFTESRQDIYAKFKKYFLMPEEKRTKAAYIDLLSEVSEYNNRVQGVGRADIPRITGESIRNALRQAVRAPRKERIRAGGTLYGATAVGRPSFAPQAPKAPRAPQAPARPLAAAMPQRRLRDFMETA